MSFAEIFGSSKRVLGLLCGVVCVIQRLAVPVEHRLVTDGRTDRQTDTELKLKQIPALASVARVKISVVYGGEEFLEIGQHLATVTTKLSAVVYWHLFVADRPLMARFLCQHVAEKVGRLYL